MAAYNDRYIMGYINQNKSLYRNCTETPLEARWGTLPIYIMAQPRDHSY